MIIVGAGLAGLIAGNLIHDSEIHEANAKLVPHRAVLRFRSQAVGDALGIQFREVTVRKGIWDLGKFVEPNIRLANQYSWKVTHGQIADRSIWNLESAKRWIAPENFAEQLAKRLGSRLKFEQPFVFSDEKESQPIISTAPMSLLARAFGTSVPMFRSSPIYARRYRIRDCDVHQTIYFPDVEMRVYRASITGDVLSCEFIEEDDGGELDWILNAFAISKTRCEFIDDGVQRHGKIVPIDDTWRRNFIHDMSQRLGIYSLGRFATWRNILLDDVLHDIAVIKKLISMDRYGKELER